MPSWLAPCQLGRERSPGPATPPPSHLAGGGGHKRGLRENHRGASPRSTPVAGILPRQELNGGTVDAHDGTLPDFIRAKVRLLHHGFHSVKFRRLPQATEKWLPRGASLSKEKYNFLLIDWLLRTLCATSNILILLSLLATEHTFQRTNLVSQYLHSP
ncbi:MAG: hypothetical protein A3B90_01135 [Candidatus Magasanikbacteria bacterium RIFCSPHIGHO2_02_FULL_41_13]|uniref:Uncharacterized protein n=1 Tax=Candidatus Magasanikbacteria bacterium RIFCSPHIGHO2_02_FULL_41_13 TaxID=1798676 RepID=A0A1F6M535_9BACT|nr:MAG: hypothetical protein A3B90_01135 [Candidatus Magasanikbacteria bacterium RIFCSPHIGHO2_02_FULL_41_13]